MTRRLLGPVGGSILFLVVAALVFSVLGWVTHSALTVEQAQREAAGREELGSKLRVALWRLDGRMLPALGVEDSRPFYHYGPADPDCGYGLATTPLLVTTLPDWMKLHFQLDAANGWESPQVLSPEVAERVRQAYPDLPLRNVNLDRQAILAELRRKYPAQETLGSFASRDQTVPSDAFSLATPLQVNAGAPLLDSVPNSMPAPSSNSLLPTISPSKMESQAPYSESKREPIRLFGIELCTRPDYAPNAVASNTQRVEVEDPQKRSDGTTGPNPRPVPGQNGTPQYQGRMAPKNDRASTIYRGMNDISPPPGSTQSKVAVGNNALIISNSLKDEMELKNKQQAEIQSGLGVRKAASEQGFFYRLSEKVVEQECLEALQQELKKTAKTGLSAKQDEDKIRKNNGLAIGGGAMPLPPAKPADTPATAAPVAKDAPIWSPPVAAPMPPLAVHLGSMRPQWMIAADGTEMLVLARLVQVDNKMVCQGIILDWTKLEATLKEEVKELFPNAKLVPIKDTADVSPDRAMTALPVQLEPGTQPEPTSAGWTTLRLGLVLAWAAAIIAFAAVGFSGWTLIDLAERRIRFVSAVTHELRTPLTSLRLYLDLLVSGMIQDEAKKQEYLNTLATESDRLHRLIDNVLDFARLEKRRTNSEIKPITIAELVEQLRETWANRLVQDGKELIVISTLAEGSEFKTDAAMIQQIIGNLIDNARKYAREAEDKRIWVWAKPGGRNTVLIEVEDRGPGVPPKERRAIFKPFRRGDHADRTSGGAGLGLALAKSWAEVLGGKLTYRPAEGGMGACFRLELPIA